MPVAVVGAPTLRALLGRPELGLRLAGDGADLDTHTLDQPVRWVHSSDLADPTPFLADDLVLLTTGTQFSGADDASPDFEAYVRRLTSRGVLGLGFGTEVVRDGVPTGLTEACRALQMPLFEVPYRTPFIAVARANAEAVAAHAYARRTWALDAQRALALAALRPDGLGATLAELARQLNTWVGLFDASGTLTREHPSGGLDAVGLGLLADEVGAVLRRGARAASSLRVGPTPFTLQTLGRGGHLRGVIALAAGELDQESRGVVTAVIAMAGLALEQNQGLARARAALRAGLVHSLLTDDPGLGHRIARDLWGGLPAEPLVVAVASMSEQQSDAVTEWLELRAAEIRGDLAFGGGDHGLVLAVPAAHHDVLEDLATRFELRVGVSLPAGYSGFARAHGQALIALGSGSKTGAGTTPAGVSRFGDVAASGVLAAIDSDTARAVADAALEPLIRHDATEGTALLETARAWLEHDARIDAAAISLGVHRHTVRARIAQAERLLGVDLGSFAARADLWAALRIAQ